MNEWGLARMRAAGGEFINKGSGQAGSRGVCLGGCGEARLGSAKFGRDRKGSAGLGSATLSGGRKGSAGLGNARQGSAGLGSVSLGKVRPDSALLTKPSRPAPPPPGSPFNGNYFTLGPSEMEVAPRSQ